MKMISTQTNTYKMGYSKSNCFVQGLNPDLEYIVASPFVEKFSKNGKDGMALYAYQDTSDINGKKWQHQPIKIKVFGLNRGFELGDKVRFDNLECVRIVIRSSKGSSSTDYYYQSTGVHLVKEADNNA